MMKTNMDYRNKLLHGNAVDVLQQLPSGVFNCCVTSPPYFGLRDYGVDGQIGLESTPDEYVQKLIDVFREVWRVLRDDGTLWLNLGDSYTRGKPKDTSQSDLMWSNQQSRKPAGGLKPKDLLGIPWRVAFALQADGWYLRSDIIWHKTNPRPESVTDRPTKAHEYVFLLSKSVKYYYDADAIKEPAVYGLTPSGVGFGHGTDKDRRGRTRVKACSFARKVQEEPPPGQVSQHRSERKDTEYRGTRNKRTVWTISTKPFKKAHFATFPPDLIEPCILAGCPENGIVLDPFIGAGTTAVVAQKLNRNYCGIDLNSIYIKEIALPRLGGDNG